MIGYLRRHITRRSGRARAVTAACGAILFAALPATGHYAPPRIEDVKAKPSFWLLQIGQNGPWCAFGRERDADAAAQREEAAGGDSASIYVVNGRIGSILYSGHSEDADADDVYIFDDALTITRLVRTGHYINDPVFSVVYRPDGQGRLMLDDSSRTIVKRMNAARHETYIVEWPRFDRLARFPFRGIIVSMPRAAVREGCPALDKVR